MKQISQTNVLSKEEALRQSQFGTQWRRSWPIRLRSMPRLAECERHCLEAIAAKVHFLAGRRVHNHRRRTKRI